MKILSVIFMSASIAAFAQPSPSEGIPFTFNPLAVKRDPFLAPEDTGTVKGSEIERYELAQLQLVGIMEGLGATKAMIVTPTKRTYIVQKGDIVGRNSGTITRISSSEVFIKESFRDFQGRTRVETARMALAQ